MRLGTARRTAGRSVIAWPDGDCARSSPGDGGRASQRARWRTRSAPPTCPTRRRIARSTRAPAGKCRRLARSRPRLRDRASTSVVCQRDSLSARTAVDRNGHEDRLHAAPHAGPRDVTAAEGHALLDLNRRLFRRCRFHSIQAAVNASGNNGRVVIMPGLYTEPESRPRRRTTRPATQYEITNDRGQPGALSYKYQWYCPNDQNLIAVLGREPGADRSARPPFDDRHGIPDLGPCIRCNLQIEGSGVGPDDVIDRRRARESGDGGPHGSRQGRRHPRRPRGRHRDPQRQGPPRPGARDLRARDRRLPARPLQGLLRGRVRRAHVRRRPRPDAELRGRRQRTTRVSTRAPAPTPGSGATPASTRSSATARRSATATRTTTRAATRARTATPPTCTTTTSTTTRSGSRPTSSRRPGTRASRRTRTWSSTTTSTRTTSIRTSQPAATELPPVPVPVGAGLWIAGGNDNIVRYNHFYDNWRRGAMLFAVPDQLVCGPGVGIDPSLARRLQPGRSAALDLVPERVLRQRDGPGALSQSSAALPRLAASGPLRWMDTGRAGAQRRRKPFGGPGGLLVGRVPGNTENCWHDNVGQDGTAGSLTSLPPSPPPGSSRNAPHVLPHICDDTSVGAGGAAQEEELVDCLAAFSPGRRPKRVRGSRSRPTRPPRPIAPKQGTNRPGAVVLRRAARRLRGQR